MKKHNGYFVISLDFELLWGVYDLSNAEKFKADVEGGRQGIPLLLELFEKYGIHATWGIVGLLFARSKDEATKYIPPIIPSEEYKKGKSPYKHLKSIGENEEIDIYHYAPSLIRKILEYDNQEIASHTFSHFFCHDSQQTYQSFEADIHAACDIAKDTLGIELKSLIFPKNHYKKEYLKCLSDTGFVAVRGNPRSFAYNRSSLICRMLRFIDTYIPVCGKKHYDIEECSNNDIIDVKASVFFRKYCHKLRFLESIKLRSIKRQMKKAAKKGKVFHLWWHPHNMGSNLNIFLKQIEELLIYYNELNVAYGFESANMCEIAEVVKNVESKSCNVMQAR